MALAPTSASNIVTSRGTSIDGNGMTLGATTVLTELETRRITRVIGSILNQ